MIVTTDSMTATATFWRGGAGTGPARAGRLARRGILALTLCFSLAAPVLGGDPDASGRLVYTQRFDGAGVVFEAPFEYVRGTPSLTFGTPRVIWSGAGAPGGFAGSDGLFFTPANELVVANWEATPSSIWKFDPLQTDVVLDGPVEATFAFHLLLHPNLEDGLATEAFGFPCNCIPGDIPCGCFGIFDHTALTAQNVCIAPPESDSSDVLQPVTFAVDSNNNVFVVFSDGRAQCSGCPVDTGIEFGGGGFASFDLAGSDHSTCSGSMSMTRLIPQEISAAHSMVYDPFLSDPNDGADPHSDFIVFANSRVSHIRVDEPGTPSASAAVVSTVDMAVEEICDSLLPSPGKGLMNEFDQGSVTGTGLAIVGDEMTGNVALIDYSQNTNGTIIDGSNTVCLVSFLHDEIDDIAPLFGIGSSSLIFHGDFEDMNTCDWSVSVGGGCA